MRICSRFRNVTNTKPKCSNLLALNNIQNTLFPHIKWQFYFTSLVNILGSHVVKRPVLLITRLIAKLWWKGMVMQHGTTPVFATTDTNCCLVSEKCIRCLWCWCFDTLILAIVKRVLLPICSHTNRKRHLCISVLTQWHYFTPWFEIMFA